MKNKKKQRRASIKNYCEYTEIKKKDLIKISTIAVISAIFVVLCEIFYVNIFVSEIITNGKKNWILLALIGIVIFSTMNIIVFNILRSVVYSINKRTQINLKNKIYKDFINTKIENVVSISEGEVSNILINASTSAELIIQKISDTVINYTSAILYFIFLLVISWQIALIVFIGTVVVLLIYNLVSKLNYKASSDITKAYGEFFESTRETFDGQITVKVDNVSAKAEQLFEVGNKTYTKNKNKELIMTKITNLINFTLITMLMAFVYGTGGNFVLLLMITSGSLYSAVQFGSTFVNNVKWINTYLTDNRSKLSNFSTSIAFKDMPKERIENDELNTEFNFKKAIEFKQINHYYKGEFFFKNFNLKVNKQEHIYIVQKNALAVQSMFNILVGFYEQKGGNILIDGVNIKDISLKKIRDNIAFAFKDPEILNETFMFNLTMGKKELEDRAVEICKEVGLHNHIMSYKNGYDTIISNNTKTLSLMEKQMVSVTRAIISGKEILLINNALNDMDDLHAGRFISYIKYNMTFETCLIATNKTNLINDDDRVIFFGDKIIKKDCNHGELIETNSEYSEMVERYKTAKR